jgi:hypothetical protein
MAVSYFADDIYISIFPPANRGKIIFQLVSSSPNGRLLVFRQEQQHSGRFFYSVLIPYGSFRFSLDSYH